MSVFYSMKRCEHEETRLQAALDAAWSRRCCKPQHRNGVPDVSDARVPRVPHRSGDTSSTCFASVHLYPSASSNCPDRAPSTASRFFDDFAARPAELVATASTLSVERAKPIGEPPRILALLLPKTGDSSAIMRIVSPIRSSACATLPSGIGKR